MMFDKVMPILTSPRKRRLAQGRLRLAFVIPWFGKDILGGAESECRNLVLNILRLTPEVEADVITTSLKAFAANWNDNIYPQGIYDEEGIKVYRFPVQEHDRHPFGPMNQYRLMPQIVDDLYRDGTVRSPLTPEEETLYLENMIISPGIIRFIKKNFSYYDYFVFIPYMFATTYYGILAAKTKSVLIPCLHDERYAYLNLYRRMMARAQLVCFHVPSEQRLAKRIYHLQDDSRQMVVGEMVNTNPPQGNAQRFRDKYGISTPYLLYSGRVIEGKNVLGLVQDFLYLGKISPSDLKLVIIGDGDLDLVPFKEQGVLPLGFLPEQDKFDVMSGALALCQPSTNESFSIVMMEAWLQETPVLVNAACEVTKDHCQISGGGLAYEDEKQFANHVKLLSERRDEARKMAGAGKIYVLDNFSPETIVERFLGFLAAGKAPAF